MTDQEKVEALFNELGIEWKRFVWHADDADPTIIALVEGSEKIDGYPGFHCVFSFDDDGKFEKVDIGE